MYRNSEGYADPTVGAALAHIAYEERLKRRKARQQRKNAAQTAADAIKKKQKEEQQKAIRNKKRETHNSNQIWIQSWPKKPSVDQNMMGGNE